MPRACRWAVLALLALALGACFHRVPLPTDLLEKAALSAARADSDARSLALAGFHAWLVKGEPERAGGLFDQSVKRDAAEPWGLWGQLLAAKREGHPERALAAAFLVCERAPAHPLAVLAARQVAELSGVARATDEQILQRVPRLLERNLGAEASHLLRTAVANVLTARGDPALGATLAAMGVPTRLSLAGPVSPYHLLSFDELCSAEKDGQLFSMPPGPLGPIVPRTIDFPDGRWSLAAESASGDGYLAVVDIQVHQSAEHLVRVVSSAPLRAYLDGTLLFERRAFARTGSTVSSRGVRLAPGKHRLLVRVQKDVGTGPLMVALPRVDGRPAGLELTEASGRAGWSGVRTFEAPRSYPAADDVAQALAPEVGEVLASFVAGHDALSRDPDGAKRMVERLSRYVSGPAVTSLKAQVSSNDRTVPGKVASGRAARDLEATLERDRGDASSLLALGALALQDGRHLDALELAKQARAAFSPPGYPVAMLEARAELALGVDAAAERSAWAATEALPGLCDALELRYDVARRRDAATQADALLADLSHCPGSLTRQAEHLVARGKLDEAVVVYQRELAQDPNRLPVAQRLSDVYVAQRRFDDAAALLQSLAARWPRQPALGKRLADVLELAGRPGEAVAQRERVLALGGQDLALRRSVERARTGKEPLAEHAVSGSDAISAYEANPGQEEAASAYVLDHAAVRVWPDGSTVDRIHIVQKAFDQGGVSEAAEVALPPGAYVLRAQTIKADGRVLEPEAIEGKDTLSLPGVEVGDYVEYEYLEARAARGPAQPGFTAPSFYFQVARQPNHWSVYKVIAPQGSGLAVDPHNLGRAQRYQLSTEGNQEVFFHEERHVPPYIPEPAGPPSANEFLPFVAVGSGTRGNEGVVASYADNFLDLGRVTAEVEAFARASTVGLSGEVAVQALYAAASKKLSGRDAGLSVSAGHSVALDRGSRLWLLKASLDALGIPARLVAVRTFATDPAPYLFPNEALLPYVCLRVEPTPGRYVWLDPLVRHAPYGELPEQAMDAEAYLFPEPGKPLEKVRTPPRGAHQSKQIRLTLSLSEDGVLEGDGHETYFGYEAAQLAEALGAVAPDQREQALQGALSRYFGGAELSELKIHLEEAVGAPVRVDYHFVAPRYARREGADALVLGALTFPFELGRRYVQLAERTTPLFIDSTEANHAVVTLTLPEGWSLARPTSEARVESRLGKFMRTERQSGRVVSVEEDYRLSMARVPPDEYPAFARFAGEIDLLQARELLARKGTTR